MLNAARMEFNRLSNPFEAGRSVEERGHFEPLDSGQLLSLDPTVGVGGIALWSKLYHHRGRIAILLSGGPLEFARLRTLLLEFFVGQPARPHCGASVLGNFHAHRTDTDSAKCCSRVRSVPAVRVEECGPRMEVEERRGLRGHLAHQVGGRTAELNGLCYVDLDVLSGQCGKHSFRNWRRLDGSFLVGGLLGLVRWFPIGWWGWRR